MNQKYYFRIKRFFDLIASFLLLLVLSPILITICALVKLSSKGPALYWSHRIGRKGNGFNMPKFRTMYIDTPEASSDQLREPNAHITAIGSWLRVFSIDELPQLWSVLCGKMSIVGPRPALRSQEILISGRKHYGIDNLLPGITGWAQIMGRNRLTWDEKFSLDLWYVDNRSFSLDAKILLLTVWRVISRNGISADGEATMSRFKGSGKLK
jgi:O-antigen biosynthesis protein WbqP